MKLAARNETHSKALRSIKLVEKPRSPLIAGWLQSALLGHSFCACIVLASPAGWAESRRSLRSAPMTAKRRKRPLQSQSQRRRPRAAIGLSRPTTMNGVEGKIPETGLSQVEYDAAEHGTYSSSQAGLTDQLAVPRCFQNRTIALAWSAQRRSRAE